MKEFAKQHKHHLWVWLLLIIIAITSGYFAFFYNPTRDSNNTTQTSSAIIQDNNAFLKEQIQTTDNLSQTNTTTYFEFDETTDQTNNKAEENKPQDSPQLHSEQAGYKLQDAGYGSEDQTATLAVNNKNYSASITSSTTVYDFMQELAKETDFSFSGKEYSGLGFFVEEINGVKQDSQAGKYWIYYINSESAQVGISNYILNPNDLIEWKYETADS